MFGIEEQTRKKPKVYTYEIEKELDDPHLRKNLADKCEHRFTELKKLSQQGLDKASFEKITLLLQGYMALKKVITTAIKN